jgi:hypothetical protein
LIAKKSVMMRTINLMAWLILVGFFLRSEYLRLNARVDNFNKNKEFNGVAIKPDLDWAWNDVAAIGVVSSKSLYLDEPSGVLREIFVETTVARELDAEGRKAFSELDVTESHDFGLDSGMCGFCLYLINGLDKKTNRLSDIVILLFNKNGAGKCVYCRSTCMGVYEPIGKNLSIQITGNYRKVLMEMLKEKSTDVRDEVGRMFDF